MYLYSFYTLVLSRTDGGIFAPASRSEFSDLAGVLETVGLVELSSRSTSSPSPSKGRKIARSSSFTNAAGRGAKGQDIKLAQGLRFDEVLRGLGVGSSSEKSSGEVVVDVREEEVTAIWEREMLKIKKELKGNLAKDVNCSVFDGSSHN